MIDRIRDEVRELWGQGRVADYIPALEKVNPRQFGMAVATLDRQEYSTGDAQVCFSIQSISKVFTLAMVTRHVGDDIWDAVGREPSGNPFNSLVQLGVGGGIAAYIPGNLAVTVWSPELNRHGNSLAGMAALEHFTTDIGNSIF